MQITTEPTRVAGPSGGPTTDLRPSGDDHGGSGGPGPVPGPRAETALAFVAIRLLVRIDDRASRPAAWATIGFAREVERIRAQLAPVRTRRSLQDAYGRESFRVALDDDPDRIDALTPVRLAYALRWLELRDGCVGPTWPAMMGACG